MREILQRDFAPLAHVGDVRQLGLMVGIELVRDRITRQPYAAAEKVGMRVVLEARRMGVIVRPLGNVIVLMPPLCIGEADLSQLCTAIRDAVVRVTEG